MDRYGGELNERKRLILQAIIEAHIENGEPIGSRYVTQNKQIAYSSATIRNEMAELEEMGYLEQPHTSAGRVPSELGYRFYVDTMLKNYSMTAREISELNALLRIKLTEMDKILERASKIAAALTNYTGVALKPKKGLSSINRFDTIFINVNNFLLVMLFSQGIVKTKYIKVMYEVSAEGVERLRVALNTFIAGVTLDNITLPLIVELEEFMGRDAALVNPIIKCIYEVLTEHEEAEVKVEGVNRLLQYPEYSDMGRFKELLGMFEDKSALLNLIAEKSGNEGDTLNIFIGSENAVKVMDNSSLVFKTITSGGSVIGTIGIIGPRRMDYARVVAMLEHLSGNIKNLLGEDL